MGKNSAFNKAIPFELWLLWEEIKYKCPKYLLKMKSEYHINGVNTLEVIESQKFWNRLK